MDENGGTEESNYRRALALEMASLASSRGSPCGWQPTWLIGMVSWQVMESAGELSSTQYPLFHTQELNSW